MDRLLEILLWVLLPITVLLVFFGSSIVVALFLELFFGVSIFKNIA